MDPTQEASARLDYDASTKYFLHLADVRFKLLSFLPTLAGLGVAVAEKLNPQGQIALGTLGFTATLGILLYDQRNSQIYNGLVGRLGMIERSMSLPPMRAENSRGGAFSERPPRSRIRRILFVLGARHDTGLAMIYAAVLGAWAFVVAMGVARLRDADRALPEWVMIAAGVVVVIFFADLLRLDNRSKWEGRDADRFTNTTNSSRST